MTPCDYYKRQKAKRSKLLVESFSSSFSSLYSKLSSWVKPVGLVGEITRESVGSVLRTIFLLRLAAAVGDPSSWEGESIEFKMLNSLN